VAVSAAAALVASDTAVTTAPRGIARDPHLRLTPLASLGIPLLFSRIARIALSARAGGSRNVSFSFPLLACGNDVRLRGLICTLLFIIRCDPHLRQLQCITTDQLPGTIPRWPPAHYLVATTAASEILLFVYLLRRPAREKRDTLRLMQLQQCSV